MGMVQPTAATYQVAATYERVSTFKQAKHGYSLGAQHTDGAQFAADHGWELPERLRWTDTDSGAEWDLPGLNAMLDAAKRGEFRVLIVPDVDRFARNMVKALVLEDQLRSYGVTVQYIRFPLEDTSEGRLLKNQLYSIAEYEREKIAFRTGRGRRDKARSGRIVGTGVAPYGYRYTRDGITGKVAGLEVDPESAPLVRRLFRDVARMSPNEVCKALNAEGVPTRFSGKQTKNGRIIGLWTHTTVLAIVKNPAYLGTAAFGRRDGRKRPQDRSQWITIPCTPLVDRATWDAAHEAIARRKLQRRASPFRDGDPFTLRGLLTCGHCGGLLASTPHTTFRYYQCLVSVPRIAAQRGRQRCNLHVVRAHGLEGRVWEDVTAALTDAARLERGLNRARDEFADADLRRADRLQAVDREIQRLRAKLVRITSERLDAAPGSESEASLRAVEKETEATIGRFSAERADLAAQPMPGLSESEVTALQAFAADVCKGLGDLTEAQRHEAYTLLRLTATVREADGPGSVTIGRRSYLLDYRGLIEIPANGKEFKKFRLLFGSAGSGVRAVPVDAA